MLANASIQNEYIYLNSPVIAPVLAYLRTSMCSRFHGERRRKICMPGWQWQMQQRIEG